MKSLKPKFILFLLTFVVLSTGFTSCVIHRTHVVKHKNLPPGQAKKVSGDKSARRHAPGHR